MINLLLVDDNREIISLLRQLVDGKKRNIDTEIFEASNLESARHLVEKIEFSIVFLDLRIPGNTFEDVLKFIPYLVNRGALVMICSGVPPDFPSPVSGDAIMSECYKAGASDYMEKGSLKFFCACSAWLDVLYKKIIMEGKA